MTNNVDYNSKKLLYKVIEAFDCKGLNNLHLTKLHKIDFSNKSGKNCDNIVINKSFSKLFSVLIDESYTF